MESPADPVPVLYVTDLAYARYDPADLFDLAFLVRSPEHALGAVCLTSAEGAEGERVLDALAVRAKADIPMVRGAEGLRKALAAESGPVSLVVVGGYSAVAAVLAADRALFRERVARLFLVGGYLNDYGIDPVIERAPIDPRLQQRNPERFAPGGDPRVAADPAERAAFATLLGSGEGVIWLPRDLCLWRYAAPGILEDGGPVCELLLRELFFAQFVAGGPDADRYDAADTPVLLSALPALLLATRPDPFVWMRLFRAVTAYAAADPATGSITEFTTTTDSPNLYVVIAIDGQALGKWLTARLRVRPLAA